MVMIFTEKDLSEELQDDVRRDIVEGLRQPEFRNFHQFRRAFINEMDVVVFMRSDNTGVIISRYIGYDAAHLDNILVKSITSVPAVLSKELESALRDLAIENEIEKL